MKVTETQARTYFDALNRLTPADRYTIVETYLETVHRVGPYLSLFDHLEDVTEDYEARLTVEKALEILQNAARYSREDSGEICTGCPTHCTDPDDDGEEIPATVTA